MSHTPAPWTIRTIWSQSSGDGFAIEEQKGDEYSEESAANAKLIAAAPELLQACRKALSIIETYCVAGNYLTIKEITEEMKAAIAKAEGK